MILRILGIDPGLATMGYGIVDYSGYSFKAITYGCLRTTPDQPLDLRLLQLFNQLKQLVAEFKPHCMAVEELFFSRNSSTAMLVGQARGVILLAGADNGLQISEYTPLQIKKAVVGHGRADKKQVQYMIRVLLNLAAIPKPNDAADALAVAVCHAHHGGVLEVGP